MKRVALVIILIVIAVLGVFKVDVYAVSLNAKETNDTIDISIQTDSGIVRAVSASFEITTGNVSFDTFQWNTDLKNSPKSSTINRKEVNSLYYTRNKKHFS